MTETLSTWLISRDTDQEIAFLGAVFGAAEKPGSRVLTGDRVGHVEIDLLGAGVLMFDAGDGWPATPAHLRVHVADARTTLAAAVAHGAAVITEPTELAFGDLVARFRDPQGHRWWIHQHLADVPAGELGARFADPAAIAAMTYVQESLDREMSA